ncbi:MAG: glutamate synthase large subunit [Saprospiraceae bacterium]|nr:glutamate synthase large subunit [Saprospiraceae bacterium]
MEKNLEKQSGLYVPELESDACGIGLMANLNGSPLHTLVADVLTILENMEHRGACGCEANTGDGAGILTQIPHEFFSIYAEEQGVKLPLPGKYGVGFAFLPKDSTLKASSKAIIQVVVDNYDFELFLERVVPVDNSMIGFSALSTEPDMVQIFVSPRTEMAEKDLERKLYVLRNAIVRAVAKAHPEISELFYFSSFSCKTIVYKGQLTASQVRQYFNDLSDHFFKSAVALVHSRFSTNTVPKWKLAQPFRCIAHNGEINTVQGNVNWWNAREGDLESKAFDASELKVLKPVCSRTLSDSGNFDAVLEFLIRDGLSLPHALMMMIPEAWHNDDSMPQFKKDFYEFHEAVMEPWDGPASICFTDGKVLGATLDRNGLRPSKYCLTSDNFLILASESGVLPLNQDKIIYKGNLRPGQILIADLDQKKIIGDDELKRIVCNNNPYGGWLEANRINIDSIESVRVKRDHALDLMTRQIAQGFTKEDEEVILASMIKDGKEPIGSMGSDIPLAVLSTQAQHISHYFKQQFAQVTNPPIDPIRERPFMSLEGYLGGSAKVNGASEAGAKVIRIKSPVLNTKNFGRILNSEAHGFGVKSFAAVFNAEETGDLKKSLDVLCQDVENAVKEGVKIIIIDNTAISEYQAAIPSLMAVGKLHHYLISKGIRRRVSLLAKTGDTTEVHHFACLFGYGADAVYPELTLETIEDLVRSKEDITFEKAEYNYSKAVNEGLYKVMSKLGISTMLSYKGAQAFEAVGISTEVIDYCFKGTVSRIEGMTFEQLAKECLHYHYLAFNVEVSELIESGRYQWKRRGEFHLFNPTSIHLLQHSTKSGDYNLYKKYTEAINDQSKKACTLRSLFKIKKGKGIPIEQVESVESIMKRFATGAMSFGSISEEAHTTLAIAMNRIGGKSNSGEGGEDSARYKVKPNGDLLRSAIKQVASGRFGVTIEYLNNADELQIKMAQGAKPGEGGQLPGHKVDDTIARIRNSTPGVGLISPPPHHDIYSIEDLAQLIFDLKNSNRDARISVKLVSKAGVGIIASGVAKAHADHILISGHDGGTGASPLSSIMHAGLPWELGLSETHQTLVKNGLRDRVVIQTDGQIRTGRDMAIATMLGAEEWGIATGALVVSGCILMRKCHLNTCPVGVATQDPDLRAKYEGKVEYLINFFNFLAQDLREIMAELGVRSVNELVGRTDLLEADIKGRHWKYDNLDLSNVFHKEKSPKGYEHQTNYQSVAQDHGIDLVLDRQLIKYSELAISDRIQINSVFAVKSTDRAVGTMLSSEIAKRYGLKGLEPESIKFRFRGSAGQSFGAFGARGIEFLLEGEANDYFGKGLSGATLIVVPDRNASFDPSENIIIGNVAFFGATSGQAYIKGLAGERFCVRNSGAEVVVEGVGHNACEYMTGGRAVILGSTGRNFAAGMSGGIAYIYDKDNGLDGRVNMEMVEIESPVEEDFEYIRTMVREHFRHTSSMNALAILQNWDEAKFTFKKVIPTEYKAVMEKKKASEAANASRMASTK